EEILAPLAADQRESLGELLSTLLDGTHGHRA
ncbi:MarR family transcriptional regulator, partial [Streptomyces sp. SID10853]|nr:MarR family transcriptional regulator [Streptomyces sp. SID10853]